MHTVSVFTCYQRAHTTFTTPATTPLNKTSLTAFFFACSMSICMIFPSALCAKCFDLSSSTPKHSLKGMIGRNTFAAASGKDK